MKKSPKKLAKRTNQTDVLKLARELQADLQVEKKMMKGEIAYLKKHVDKFWEHVSMTNERLQDLEIQVNLLNRLISALALEKLNMKTFGLVKMIRKIEKQVVAEDQIQNLEKQFKLNHPRKDKFKG